ncbi:MAG: hypothetical protein RXR20_27330, partial [Paraburkholderia sp.]
MKARVVTADQVLTQIRGGSMTLAELASTFWVDEGTVKPVIAELLSKSRIEVSNNAKKEVRYKVAGAKKGPKERLNTSVAAAPTPPPLKGEIKGYTDEMRQRVELA